MNDPTEGIVDTEKALEREVDILSERFPDGEREALDRDVRAAYTALQQEARVGGHLVALTRARVIDRLRELGIHPDPAAHRIDENPTTPAVE